MTTILQTDRLLLREFTLTDADFILQLLNSPGWLRFIGDRNIHTLADAGTYLKHVLLKGYADNGFGFWLVAERSTGLSVGMCGLTRRAGLDAVDIGFALLPAYAGLGYGYEAALATVNYAAGPLGLARLVAITSVDNAASARLLAKIGLQYERMIRLPGDEEDLKMFGRALTGPAPDND